MRTRKTESGYLKRAVDFISRVERESRIESPTPQEVAAFAINQRSKWMKSTWRQNKASLMFFYGRYESEEAKEALRMLETTSESACASRSNNTSGRRRKNIHEQDFAKILEAIGQTRSSCRHILSAWMIYGAAVGLRPHEWGYAELIENESLLRVQNSKNTNGRAHGSHRHLRLDGFSPAAIAEIRALVAQMTEVRVQGEYDRLYRACQQVLARVNQNVFGSKDRWIQLYSARHRFSSEAKSILSEMEVAAAMGHAIDLTANIHYGRKNFSSGGVIAKPVSDEVQKIRKTSRKTEFLAKVARKETSSAPG